MDSETINEDVITFAFVEPLINHKSSSTTPLQNTLCTIFKQIINDNLESIDEKKKMYNI